MSQASEDSKLANRNRSCLFYGCLTFVVLTAAILVGGYLTMRAAVSSLVNNYSDPQPLSFPVTDLSASEAASLEARLTAFSESRGRSSTNEPLILTGRELNALLERVPGIAGKLQIHLEEDETRATVSIPLGDLRVPFFRTMLEGRYLNGSARLKPSIQEGQIHVTVQSIEVRGQALPDRILGDLKNRNLVQNLELSPAASDALRDLKSLKIFPDKVEISAGPHP